MSSLPPSPNDGFLISTRSTSITGRVTSERPGFLAVFNQYNSGDWHTLQAYLDWELKTNPNSRLTHARPMTFHGLPAVEAEYSTSSAGLSMR
jgi:hypothetical protein